MLTSIRVAYMATCRLASIEARQKLATASTTMAMQRAWRSERVNFEEQPVSEANSTPRLSEAKQTTASTVPVDTSTHGADTTEKPFISQSVHPTTRSYIPQEGACATPQSICFSQGFSWTQKK